MLPQTFEMARKIKKNHLLSSEFLKEIHHAFKNTNGWGSVEIFVQKGKVTQITERNIKKTNQDPEDEVTS